MSTDEKSHLGQDVIQALLDDRLPGAKRAAVEGHLASCPRCSSRLEEWKLLFRRLDALPELAPPRGFAGRVMAEVVVHTPLIVRLREWLGLGTRGPRPTGHLEPELVLEYLDEALPRHARERAAAHLEVCNHCQSEVSRWRTLVRGIESLDPVRPSEGFADGVMARVALPATGTTPAEAPTGGLDRALEWIRSLGPRTRKGWTVAAGAAGAPVAALSAAAYALFSHPQLTPTSLAAFLWWQAAGAASRITSTVTGIVLESSLIFQVWTALRDAVASPLAFGGGIAAFSVATLGASWILYRNLIAAPPVGRTHANVSA